MRMSFSERLSFVVENRASVRKKSEVGGAVFDLGKGLKSGEGEEDESDEEEHIERPDNDDDLKCEDASHGDDGKESEEEHGEKKLDEKERRGVDLTHINYR